MDFAAAAGTDPRYFACACKGLFPRGGHVIKMSFLTYTRHGHLTLDLPQITSIYGSSMIQATWYPSHYTALVQGCRPAHIEAGFIGTEHLVQEFAPELKRFFHLHLVRRNQGTGVHGQIHATMRSIRRFHAPHSPRRSCRRFFRFASPLRFWPRARRRRVGADQPYTVEYYYKCQWGHQAEFLQLFLKNHYPLLQEDSVHRTHSLGED